MYSFKAVLSNQLCVFLQRICMLVALPLPLGQSTSVTQTIYLVVKEDHIPLFPHLNNFPTSFLRKRPYYKHWWNTNTIPSVILFLITCSLRFLRINWDLSLCCKWCIDGKLSLNLAREYISDIVCIRLHAIDMIKAYLKI